MHVSCVWNIHPMYSLFNVFHIYKLIFEISWDFFEGSFHAKEKDISSWMHGRSRAIPSIINSTWWTLKSSAVRALQAQCNLVRAKRKAGADLLIPQGVTVSILYAVSAPVSEKKYVQTVKVSNDHVKFYVIGERIEAMQTNDALAVLYSFVEFAWEQ